MNVSRAMRANKAPLNLAFAVKLLEIASIR